MSSLIDNNGGKRTAIHVFPTFAEPPQTGVQVEDSAVALSRPNVLVRWAFYISVFSIPFGHLYLPGTGDRVGITRMVQLLILCAVASQPRACIRLIPTALFWFVGYCAMRMLWGFWLAPETIDYWWPSTLEFAEVMIPWFWVMFNVLQFPETHRGGLWALGLGCSLCALCHIVGIGAAVVPDGMNTRTSVFEMNANQLGVTYATAATALLGLWVLQPRSRLQRTLPFVLIAIIGVALAKTGSRSAMLMLVLGFLVLLLLGKNLGSWMKRIICLALLGSVLTLILWSIPTVMERFEELNPHNIGQDNPRARMAPVLWEMFLRSPIYGSGPDHYQFELTRRAMPYLIKEQRTIVAHNLLLLLLVETGVVGLLIFGGGLKSSLIAAWRVRHSPCGPLPLALLLPLVIGGLTLCNPSHYHVLWVAMAYALAGAG